MGHYQGQGEGFPAIPVSMLQRIRAHEIGAHWARFGLPFLCPCPPRWIRSELSTLAWLKPNAKPATSVINTKPIAAGAKWRGCGPPQVPLLTVSITATRIELATIEGTATRTIFCWVHSPRAYLRAHPTPVTNASPAQIAASASLELLYVAVIAASTTKAAIITASPVKISFGIVIDASSRQAWQLSSLVHRGSPYTR